jgi:hypothetical protein
MDEPLTLTNTFTVRFLRLNYDPEYDLWSLVYTSRNSVSVRDYPGFHALSKKSKPDKKKLSECAQAVLQRPISDDEAEKLTQLPVVNGKPMAGFDF